MSIFAASFLLLGLASGATAQPSNGPVLRLVSATCGPARHTVTDGWSTLEATILNTSDQARDARLVVFFADKPDAQFGRDVWVPGNSIVSTWLPVAIVSTWSPDGPGRRHAIIGPQQLDCLLYDTTGASARLQKRDDNVVRQVTLSYRPQELTTCVLLNPTTNSSEEEDRERESVVDLARSFREAAELSEQVSVASVRSLAPTPEGLATIRQVIVAGDNLAHDPAGRTALHRWLLQGGVLWIMLDKTDPSAFADLIDASGGPSIFDRTSLTTVELRRTNGAAAGKQEFETPVDLVRVLPGPHDRVLHTVDGWPASFIRSVGRGKVLFTTLSARAWSRARTPKDEQSSFTEFPLLPIAQPALQDLARQLVSGGKAHEFDTASFAPLLQQQVGYTLVGPGLIAGVFGGFLLIVLGAGLWLRQSQRTELLGWLGPGAALAASGVFVFVGERTRRVIPPTVASATLLDATADDLEQPINGLVAVYRPESGPIEVSSDNGGQLELDSAGLGGQLRRRIVTDAGSWYWEKQGLPAGIRFGKFSGKVRLHESPSAVMQLTPDGAIDGKLAAGTFHNLEDAVLSTPTGEPLNVDLHQDGRFHASGVSMLPGQYLGNVVLSDQQQRRQQVYSQLLGEAMPQHIQGAMVLLAWTDAATFPFHLRPEIEATGSTLLAVPVTLARPAPGMELTLPAAFVPYRRVIAGRASSRLPPQSNAATDMHVRFQLPADLLPLDVQYAELTFSAHAHNRRLTVSRMSNNGKAILQVENPDGNLQVKLQPDDFQRDDEGGLHLRVAVSDLLEARPQSSGVPHNDDTWSLGDLHLRITARTKP